MVRRLLSALVLVLVTLVFYLATGMVPHAQGFSDWKGSKREVSLSRWHPPEVYLMGTAIRVSVSSQAPQGSGLAQQMERVLESGLLSGDRRLRPDTNQPETLISCTITRLETTEKEESEKRKENRKVGERQEWNEKKKKNETKDVYQDVEVTDNYKALTGTLNVSYQVKDTRNGYVLNSDNLSGDYRHRFLDGRGAPSLSQVENIMMQYVAAQIVHRLVPTPETLRVKLARGKLDEIGKLGESRLWGQMLEKLEMMPPMARKDDAYRQYDIGVAYEAQAYQAENLSGTKQFLDKAGVHYSKALEMNPEEKYFREPQQRIDTALIQYKKIEEQQAAYKRYKSPPPQPEQGTKPVTPPSGQPSTTTRVEGAKGTTQLPAKKSFTNQDVVELMASGLNEENLIATIKTEPNVHFDVSAEGLKYLLKNKISNSVINAMRARSGSTRKPNTPRRPAAKTN